MNVTRPSSAGGKMDADWLGPQLQPTAVLRQKTAYTVEVPLPAVATSRPAYTAQALLQVPRRAKAARSRTV